jgi:hypothetical protein
MAKQKQDQEPVLESVIEIEETWEERRLRELREEYVRRNAEALAARREILRANGLPDDTQDIDPKAMVEIMKRCC